MFIFTNTGIQLMTSTVGLIYPLYLSVKGLESNSERNWLVYWLVYSTLCYMEALIGTALELLPMYHYAKLGLLLLLVRSSRTTDWIYQRTVLLVHKHCENSIDDILINAKKNLGNIQNELKAKQEVP